MAIRTGDRRGWSTVLERALCRRGGRIRDPTVRIRCIEQVFVAVYGVALRKAAEIPGRDVDEVATRDSAARRAGRDTAYISPPPAPTRDQPLRTAGRLRRAPVGLSGAKAPGAPQPRQECTTCGGARPDRRRRPLGWHRQCPGRPVRVSIWPRDQAIWWRWTRYTSASSKASAMDGHAMDDFDIGTSVGMMTSPPVTLSRSRPVTPRSSGRVALAVLRARCTNAKGTPDPSRRRLRSPARRPPADHPRPPGRASTSSTAACSTSTGCDAWRCSIRSVGACCTVLAVVSSR